MGEAQCTEIVWTCDENERELLYIYRVYEIMISGGDARERPPVVCINRMEECTGEKDWASKSWNVLRVRFGDNSAMTTPLGKVPVRGRGIRNKDR